MSEQTPGHPMAHLSLLDTQVYQSAVISFAQFSTGLSFAQWFIGLFKIVAI